jgi:hypothetical protein
MTLVRRGTYAPVLHSCSFQLMTHRLRVSPDFEARAERKRHSPMGTRREPLEVRKATLASVLRKAGHGVQLNEHLCMRTAR